MSKLRSPGEPGRYMRTMDQACGFDGGINTAPVCGKLATYHLFAGSPDRGPADWATFACDEHVNLAQGLAWDWHAVAPVCGVPGGMWQSRARQGEGFCYWPEAEAAIHGSASEPMVIA